MKLNAGSGPGGGQYLEGWVNVDFVPPKGGVRADLFSLPFPDRTFEETRLVHVLEHVNRNRQVDLLKEMYRVTSDTFYVEVPDFILECENIIKAVAEPPGKMYHEKIRILTVGIFGKQRHTGDAHHWGFTEHFLEEQLKKAGWGTYARQLEPMISNHWKVEPVLLYRCSREAMEDR